MKNTIEKSLQNTISYQKYRILISDLLSQGKSTGPNQSAEITNYSLLNEKRMKRLDKTIKLSEETKAFFKNVNKKQTWLIITEGWCGDAAQNLPVINKIAELNENIDLKLVLRDDNLELMDLFLTNGGRSIPKLIVLDEDNIVLNTWGPRPTIAAKIVADYKDKHGILDAQLKQDLQVWYNKNKGQNMQDDFIELTKNTLLKVF